jgi:molybdate transport system substrate-binding protein
VLTKLAAAQGFPPDYDRRVLANVVSQEENAKSVVSKVQLGEADAGIVYRSDVTPAVGRYVRVFEIPEASNVIATYPIAVTKSARNVESARQFVALVRSDDGQRVLQAHGLIPATVTEPASHP